MTKATPVKVYCHMHDTKFNSNERVIENYGEAKVPCPCCNRYINTIRSEAFVLPEAQDHPNAPACNCFFNIENGSYRKDYLEEYAFRRNYKTLEEAVKDSEESEKEFRETCNNNHCRIHIDCDDPECKGIGAY